MWSLLTASTTGDVAPARMSQNEAFDSGPSLSRDIPEMSLSVWIDEWMDARKDWSIGPGGGYPVIPSD